MCATPWGRGAMCLLGAGSTRDLGDGLGAGKLTVRRRGDGYMSSATWASVGGVVAAMGGGSRLMLSKVLSPPCLHCSSWLKSW